MKFLDAFPIASIDEDYEGKNSAGCGMQQLAAEQREVPVRPSAAEMSATKRVIMPV
jgi:hypothetical protein